MRHINNRRYYRENTETELILLENKKIWTKIETLKKSFERKYNLKKQQNKALQRNGRDIDNVTHIPANNS